MSRREKRKNVKSKSYQHTKPRIPLSVLVNEDIFPMFEGQPLIPGSRGRFLADEIRVLERSNPAVLLASICISGIDAAQRCSQRTLYSG